MLPPLRLNRYSGGSLIIYDGPEKIVIDAHPVDWTLIGLPINVQHECIPITNGKRIVFKTKFEIPQAVYDICAKIPLPTNFFESVQDSTTISKYENDLCKFENKNSLEKFVIVLERRYDSTDPNNLIGEDKNLFAALSKKYPLYSIKLLNKSIWDNDVLQLDTTDGLEYFSMDNNFKYTVVYQMVIKTI